MKRTKMSQTAPIPLGAHLVSPRSGYKHHGIYTGCGQVIHYSGLANGLSQGPIEEVPLEAFCQGNEFSIRPEPTAQYQGIDVVHRARSRLGEDGYNLISNNCEHFCHWCLHGKPRSKQVRRTVTAISSFVASRYLVSASVTTLGLASAPLTTTLLTGAVLGYGVNRFIDHLEKKDQDPRKKK